MADDTSLTLIQRLRANEPDAWARLVRLYRPLAFYWCGRWGVRGADADDIAQELFQTAAQRLPDFRREQPGDSFRGWLRGITRNLLFTHARRLKRQPQAGGGTEAQLRLNQTPAPTDADADDPPEELRSLHARALDQVRSEFTAKAWDAFYQTAVNARAAADVAADLGMTAVAVRQAKSRVLRRLKEELGEVLD